MTFSKFTTSAALMGSLALSACGSSNPDAIREGAAPKSFQSGNDAVTYNTDTGIVTLNGSTAVQNGDQVNKSRGQASVITSQDGMFFTSIARDGITYAVSSVSTTGTPLSGQVYGTEGRAMSQIPSLAELQLVQTFRTTHFRATSMTAYPLPQTAHNAGLAALLDLMAASPLTYPFKGHLRGEGLMRMAFFTRAAPGF